MPHAVSSLKRPSSYSHCPLKKRPIKYEPADDSDSDLSCKGPSVSPSLPLLDYSEPENLSTKPEDLRLNGKEKKSSSIPPPIALVAGNRDGNNFDSSSHFPVNASQQGRLLHYGSPAPTSLPLKSLSNVPLEPISLNNSSWSKNSSYSFSNNNTNNNLMPSSGRLSGSAFENFASLSSVPPQSLLRSLPHQVPQYNSHYAPLRDGGSPPHVSPPLSQEPAYPVLRIEESNRSRMISPPTPSQTAFSEESYMRAMYEQNHHHHSNNNSHNHHHHHHHHDHRQEQLSPSALLMSPSDLPYIIRSSPSQSPPVDDDKSCRSLSPSGKPIVPTNVNGSVRYQCPDCNKSYSTFSGLSKHLQFHCASQNKKSFVCKFCEKEYVSLGALKMHIRTHTLPCKCNLCGKAFSRPWLLQGHIRTHTGEKPFSCQHCNRAFADRSNLRAHLQTHSEVKKYSCKSCSKTFSRMSLLVKHEDGGCNSSPMSLSNQE